MLDRIPFVLLFAALLAGCGDPASTASGGTSGGEDPLAAYEGGDPMPAGPAKIGFLWIGKQSVLCVGESFEKQVAFVDFSAEGGAMEVGSVTLDADGGGKARFAIPVATLRTGHVDRDRKLQGAVWLDAESHPEIVFESTKLERVRPTVWRVEGNWTMKGVSKPVTFYANVRYLPEMRNVGEDVVRMKASFDIDLAAHGVAADYQGSPAVAATWTVQLVLLGTMKREG